MGKSDQLTARQERFAREYLIDSNGKRAAIAAGYSRRSAEQTASTTLRIPKVKRFLAELTAEQSERLSFTADDILRELSNLATQTIVPFIDDEGYLKMNLKNIPPEAMACISEVVQETFTDKNGNTVKRLKVKLHDRIKAISLAGRHISIQAFASRVEVDAKWSSLAERMREIRRRNDAGKADEPRKLH